MVDRLIAGAVTFRGKAFREQAALFAELSQGQAPETLLITCADSRIDPSLIFDTSPGDIFVIRNAGNIVPVLDADGTSGDGTAASIAALPSIGRWLEHSEALRVDGTDDLDDLIARNVALQLEHLSTYPTVQAAHEAESVELHGWIYDIASGTVSTDLS